jgi:hypothetical protein
MTTDCTAHHKSPLEISELAMFDKNIEGCSPDEAKAKRLAYLKQAMQQVGIAKSMFKGMGCVMIPMIIIPLFWPFLALFWYMRKKTMAALDSQIITACEYWNIPREEIEDNPYQPRSIPRR